MKRFAWFLSSASLFVVTASGARAELPSARLNGVFPPGGKAGTTFDVTLTGANLENLSGLRFDRPGISAKLDKGATFHVTIADDTPPGPVDVRAIGEWGISNPRALLIGSLPHQPEKEPNDLPKQATPMPLDAVAFGKIEKKADVDHFRFPATKGQRIVAECFAKRVDSQLNPVLTLVDERGNPLSSSRRHAGDDPLLDFVAPADGEYIVRLNDVIYNGSGERHYLLAIHTKPRIAFAYPPVVAPGTSATVALYGRNLPGGKPDDSAKVNGRPLEVIETVVAAPGGTEADPRIALDLFARPDQAHIDWFTHRAALSESVSRPIRIALPRHPVTVESEENDSPAKAQMVTIPAELVGRLDRPGDADWFRFSAKKGQKLTLEGISERMGFSADLVLVFEQVLPQLAGKESEAIKSKFIGEYDDLGANVGRFKFISSSHDPVTTVTIPADGDYLLAVKNRYANGGDARFVYRVVVGPVHPDFRLAVMPIDEANPSAVVVRQGGTTYVHVFALRHDGYAGEIRVEGVDLPEGVTVPPVVLGPNVNETGLVIVADPKAPVFSGPVTIRGTATIGDKKVTRTARAASIVWPATGNAPRPARLTSELCLAVRENAPYRLSAKPDRVTVAQGSQLDIALDLERRQADFTKPLKDATAFHLPGNVENQKVTIGDKATHAMLHLYFKNNVAPGTYSFLVRGSGPTPFTKTPKDPKAKKADVAVDDPSLPVTVTVIPRPCDLTATPPTPTIKMGEKATIKVAVKRVGDFKGPVKLSLTVPEGVKGVSAPEVTVPADKNEGTLEVAVAGDAPPGAKAFLTVRGVAETNGKAVAVDAKLTVTVPKKEPKKDAKKKAKK